MNKTIEKMLLRNADDLYALPASGAENAAALRKAGVRPLFVDVSCVVYRILYAKASEYRKRCGSDGEKICHWACADILFDIADCCRHFAVAPILSFDSKTSLRKEKIFSGYKGKRGTSKKTADEEFVVALKSDVVRLIRTIYAPAYKVQSFVANGYESDDIIAHFVLGLKNRREMEHPALEDGHQVTILSSDADLHQLVRWDDVYWIDAKSGILCKGSDLEKHTGVSPADVVLAKAIGGCASDDIPNVPSCGEKTIAEIISTRSFNVSLRKARENLASPSAEETIDRNLKLVMLPFEGMPDLFISSTVWPEEGTPKDAEALFSSYGIPETEWPSFSGIRAKKPITSVPTCGYVKKC